jgi:hypothetical protein
MGRFARAELEEAFAAFQQRGETAGAAGDWGPWADQFTEDARYVEHAYGTFEGREAIRRWITATMSSFPGSRMPTFPVSWSVVDEERGWIVFEVFNRMEDPGDGSVHQAANITVLHYAGDGLWSSEEDVYNPADFLHMLQGWRRRSEELGTLPDDARDWFAAMGV